LPFALNSVIPTYKLIRAEGHKSQNVLRKIKGNVRVLAKAGNLFLVLPG